MQHITEKLHDDHEKVNRIFKQLNDTSDHAEKTRLDLCQKLKDELLAHAKFEEEVFYPSLRSRDGADELVAEAIGEHQQVESMLNEIERVSPASQDFMEKISELESAVQHHVEEEEREMFPIARKVFQGEEGEQMARQHDEMVQQYMQSSP